ncbi:MAG: RNA 3'-terminal phosphate cyclase [candidate division WOR-3 bacterium]|nr:RNA 3'-terminal phosphate cyclase [candidate division WOR-3 bacterium]
MIRIDGSFGEGGGQILRTALALSAALKVPFEIVNIRKKRKRPGLLPQHLTAVNAVAKICNAEVTGNKFGSTELVFRPQEIRAGEYEFDVAFERGSAGATTLVAQAILPVLMLTESKVKIKGGTHVPYSPPFDFLKEILIPHLNQGAILFDARLIRYGFYPVGRGEIIINFFPCQNFNGISLVLERGSLKQLSITAKVAHLPISIASRQIDELVKLINTEFPNLNIKSEAETVIAASPGTYLFLKAEFSNITVGFSGLGEKGKPAEMIAHEVYENFRNYLLSPDSVYEHHLADQICIFVALSRFRYGKRIEPIVIKTDRVTEHLQTNIWLIQQFIPGFQPLVKSPAL